MNVEKLKKIPEESDLFFYPGCLSVNIYPGIETSTIKVLSKLGYNVHVPEEVLCCGLPLFLAGILPSNTMYAIVGRILAETQNKYKNVITVCNGCYSSINSALENIKNNNESMKIIESTLNAIGLTFPQNINCFHIAELFYKMRKKISELAERPLDDLKVAVHYGCHYLYSHQNKVLDSSEHPKYLDEIVSTLGGISIDYEEKDLCCGEPALRSIRDLSFELARRKILSILEEEVDLILVMCPSCLRALDKIQFEMISFEEISSQIPVVHVSQLVGLAFGLDPVRELGLNLHLSSKDFDQSSLRKILSEQ